MGDWNSSFGTSSLAAKAHELETELEAQGLAGTQASSPVKDVSVKSSSLSSCTVTPALTIVFLSTVCEHFPDKAPIVYIYLLDIASIVYICL